MLEVFVQPITYFLQSGNIFFDPVDLSSEQYIFFMVPVLS